MVRRPATGAQALRTRRTRGGGFGVVGVSPNAFG
jgi:hypothetical protein